MVQEELILQFRTDVAPEVIARAWMRLTPTSDISLEALQTFVTNAKRVGSLRSIPDLSELMAVP
jgi:NitT/TauT family transport system substrate-binding protein